METLEMSVVNAMDGSDSELFRYLPYILQDIWELGSSPEIVKDLVKKHININNDTSALDLGCGKGAVSIKLAYELGIKCLGIDAIKMFIEEAILKSKIYGVDSLCQFEVGDIRKKINEVKKYDIIILGAIGPVFGDYYETLTQLSKCLNQKGIIIIDDGFIKEDSNLHHPKMQNKKDVVNQIKNANMKIIDEIVIEKDDQQNMNDDMFAKLKNRCLELMNKYPEKKLLFEQYINQQEKENDILENSSICSTIVIQ